MKTHIYKYTVTLFVKSEVLTVKVYCFDTIKGRPSPRKEKEWLPTRLQCKEDTLFRLVKRIINYPSYILILGKGRDPGPTFISDRTCRYTIVV